MESSSATLHVPWNVSKPFKIYNMMIKIWRMNKMACRTEIDSKLRSECLKSKVPVAHLRVNGNEILIFIANKYFVSVGWNILGLNQDPRGLKWKA
jgi:hypothetical protein